MIIYNHCTPFKQSINIKLSRVFMWSLIPLGSKFDLPKFGTSLTFFILVEHLTYLNWHLKYLTYLSLALHLHNFITSLTSLTYISVAPQLNTMGISLSSPIFHQHLLSGPKSPYCPILNLEWIRGLQFG